MKKGGKSCGGIGGIDAIAGTVNRSRGVRARIGLYRRISSDHPAGGEPYEDDAIRGDAPFGGAHADRPHRRGAVGDAEFVVSRRLVGRPDSSPRTLAGIGLSDPIFQDEGRDAAPGQPLGDFHCADPL
jgi:hypothetical protein